MRTCSPAKLGAGFSPAAADVHVMRGTAVVYLAALALLAGLTCLPTPVAGSDVKDLTDENFEHDTQAATGATTGNWFVMVSSWCMCAYIYMCTHVILCVHMCVYVFVCVCTCVCMCLCVCAHVCVCVCVCVGCACMYACM